MGYFKKNKISAFYYFVSAQFIHYEFSFAQLSKFNKYRFGLMKSKYILISVSLTLIIFKFKHVFP